MGRTTGIAWCDHTWSPWWGCVECDSACDNCYARELSHRFGHDVWGKDAPRRFFSDEHWKKPFAWDAAAERDGVLRRVFPSMCDPFEDYTADTAQTVNTHQGLYTDQTRSLIAKTRGDFWKLIESTPNLIWLLLTKRPQNIVKMVPQTWLKKPLTHVYYGVTVANEAGYWRYHALSETPAAARFVSYEPGLEEISLRDMLQVNTARHWQYIRPDQLIIGGESGSKARPFQIEWARRLILECREYGIAPFMKQYGSKPFCESTDGSLIRIRTEQSHGTDPAEWLKDLRVQEYIR